MQEFYIFTDGSVNTKTKVGYGATLLLQTNDLGSVKHVPQIHRFENTSSTKLEIECLLWILEGILIQYPNTELKLQIYSDSQNIIGLPKRKQSL